MSATKESSKKKVLQSDKSKSEGLDDSLSTMILMRTSPSRHSSTSSPYIRIFRCLFVKLLKIQCSDIKGIVCALKQIKGKEQKDGQKKNEETISRGNVVASNIKSNLDGFKLNQNLRNKGEDSRITGFSNGNICKSLLKNETAKFQAVYRSFCKEKASHLQGLKDEIDKYEEEKGYSLDMNSPRRKEKIMLSEHEKQNAAKIAELDESMKKTKKDDNTFSILRKTLGSFLGNASDEGFPPNENSHIRIT